MRYVIPIIAICAVAIGILFLIGPAEADTIIVDDDWAGADYNTIGEALINAEPYDTIRVYAGTYKEANDVRIPLDLIGNGTDTIIDGEKPNGINFDHVFGFTLTGGNANVSGFYFYDWWPTHHYAGVGVYSDNNRIFDNTFYYNARGMFLGGCSDNTVYNNTFERNMYGLLVYEGANNVNVTFNTFTRHYNYGILWCKSSGGTIFSNYFVNESISIHRSDNFTIMFNMFDLSMQSVGGRALSLNLVEDTEVHDNAFLGHGMGIRASGTTNLEIHHNTFSGGPSDLSFQRTWSGRTQTGLCCNGTRVHQNNFLNTSTLGINATTNILSSIDARGNWWGDASGPYHAQNNSQGIGPEVMDHVTFSPWLTSMVTDLPPLAYIQGVSPSFTNEGEQVWFTGRGLARNWTTEHLWTSSIDGEIYSGTDIVFSLDDLSPGRHTIGLKVKDTYGDWSKEVVTSIFVNGRPTVSIVSISPPLVNDGETVTFVGKAFDHEDDIRYVEWESNLNGVLSTSLEFETDQLSNGTHEITLRVRDGFGYWSEIATGEAIVNGKPRAIIDAIEDPLVNEGDAIIFRGAYIDHEDGVVDFFWTSDIDGELSDQQMFYTSSLSNGTHLITFRVLDDFEVWSEDVTATVVVNGLPKAEIASIHPKLPTTGDVVSFDGRSYDHEQEMLSYEWWSDIDGPLSTFEDFETNRLSRGVHTITFRAMDGQRIWSEWAWASVTVNGRPEAWIESTDTFALNEGETFHLVGGFSDPEGDIREYQWESDIDGVIGTFWNLTTSDLTLGPHIITFRVMDGLGAWSAEATAEVTINGLPTAIIVEISPELAQEGEPVRFIGAYLDHEGDLFEFEWISDRDGHLSDSMGFETPYLSNGTHIISYRVMDGHGAWSEAVTGEIKVNGRPTCWIESTSATEVMQGETVHFAGDAEDELAVVAYRWTSSLDGPLSDISVFSTSDLSPGTHEVTFTAQDDKGIWAIAASTIIEVGAWVVNADVVSIDLPETAIEGTQVIISCVIENDGNVALVGLIVEVDLGEHVVGVHTLAEPLHPGSRTTVELAWITEVGDHLATVELVHNEVMVDSSVSQGSILVEPIPDDDTPEPPVPDDTSRVTDGNDAPGMTFVMVLIAAFVATSYMGILRPRKRY